MVVVLVIVGVHAKVLYSVKPAWRHLQVSSLMRGLPGLTLIASLCNLLLLAHSLHLPKNYLAGEFVFDLL